MSDKEQDFRTGSGIPDSTFIVKRSHQEQTKWKNLPEKRKTESIEKHIKRHQKNVLLNLIQNPDSSFVKSLLFNNDQGRKIGYAKRPYTRQSSSRIHNAGINTLMHLITILNLSGWPAWFRSVSICWCNLDWFNNEEKDNLLFLENRDTRRRIKI